MGRRKVDMKFITKEKTRNTTYEKRKVGMIKKASEFQALCDVDTAVIIYPPNSNTPEIWAKNPDDVNKSIAAYKSKDENGKRIYGLKDYFEERKKTMESQLEKARKRNMEAKYPTWFEELDGLSEGQLRHFAMELEKKENRVRECLEFQKRMRFDPVNNCHQYAYAGGSSHLQQGLDQVQVVNHRLMNHGLGWLGGAPTTSFVPMKSTQVGGYGYNPLFEGGMVYGNSNHPWLMFQQPAVVQGGVMPEMAMQGFDSQVNNGVGDFVMGHYGGRYLG